jgi:hypothetical protein
MRAPFDQPLAQATPPAKALLEPSHPTIIVLVIIPKEVQQAMQRKHADFGLK